MIKYLGSKRRLVPVLVDLCERSGARTALDLFTGTTRVAQAFKQRGMDVIAVDTARYAEVFAQCAIATDATTIDELALDRIISRYNRLPGRAGYVTETFCRASRYFQPENGERIDAIRDAIDRELAGTPLFPILLTSLIEAADRVDSTTGVQMAYVKQWSPRSSKPLELRVPTLLPGPGRAIRADACALVGELDPVDVAYLDPPYNQHRYYTNYHIWETLVAWDAPDHYGVACKRADSRDEATKSVFNQKRAMPAALGALVADVAADVVIVSYNDESWVPLASLVSMCAPRGTVRVLGFDQRRYVGAQIGIHDPAGRQVGQVSHLRNTEYVAVAGPRTKVDAMVAPYWTEYGVTATERDDPDEPDGDGALSPVAGSRGAG